MSSATVHAAVRTWLEANWTTTELRFENESQDPPADGATFIYVELDGGFFDQESIGAGTVAANLWREEGTLFLDVCVPTGDRTKTTQGLQYRETLALALRGLQLTPGITFREIAFGVGEKLEGSGNYYRLPLTAAFFRDQ